MSGHRQRRSQTGLSSFLNRSHVLLNEWKEMYSVFSRKIVIGDSIFTSSTGLQFYAVIRTTQRSSRFGSAKAVPLFLIILRPWVLSRARELNPRPPALESSALPTEPILLLNKSFTHVEPRLAYKVWCACSHCTKQCHRNPIRYVTTRF